MGGGASRNVIEEEPERSEQEIVDLMMPLYYDPIDCTPVEHKIAEDCWNLVMTDKCPVYLEKFGTEGFIYTSCVTFFYDNFYVRLFDTLPASKELFSGAMKGQGKMLVALLTLALSAETKPDDFEIALLKLAKIHYKKGVKAAEYGIVGDVLMWTLRKVMGEAYYTPELHRIWIKIYSRMLKTLVPAGVTLELKGEKDPTTPRSHTHKKHHDDTVTFEDSFLESQKLIDTHKSSMGLRPAEIL